MKTFPTVVRAASLLFALGAAAGSVRAENAPAKPVPQPRVRLSPEVQVPPARVRATPSRSAAEKPTTGTPAAMMDKVVVKETPVTAQGPVNPAVHQGDFTLRDGGTLARGNTRAVDWEIGVWPRLPWTDVMAEEAIKFPKHTTQVETELVRVHW